MRVLGTAPWRRRRSACAPRRSASLVDPEADAAHDRQPGRRRPRARRRHAAPGERRHGRRAADRRHAHGARRARRVAHAAGRAGGGGRGDLGLGRAAEPVARRARRERPRARARGCAELHYAIKRDGYFGSEDLEAVYAFQKVERLAAHGTRRRALWARIVAARAPLARYGGDHVEIDKTRQVLFVVRGGKVTLMVATSTGATGNTPLGTWHVYRKVGGFDWVLYYPSYFLRGFAVHGYPDVPPYPGLARLRAHPDVDRADRLRADRLRLDGIRVPMSSADDEVARLPRADHRSSTG